jgi:C-terminal processing protease CtpA/Prc
VLRNEDHIVRVRHFDENYAFFKKKSVDWRKQYTERRPKVTKTTGYHEAAGGLILWGGPAPDVGYVAVHAMTALFSSFGQTGSSLDVDGVERIFDTEIIPFLAGKKTVIFDARFNAGGHDSVGLAIAARFADRRWLACTKATRDGDTLMPAQATYVEPKGPLQYDGPVYLLTSDLTASAAEAFTLAMMTLSQVTRVGGTTNGVSSDQWFAPLPNGWMLNLSNEVYLPAEDVSYEGSGVSSDIEASVFVPAAFRESVDCAYEAALRLASEY